MRYAIWYLTLPGLALNMVSPMGCAPVMTQLWTCALQLESPASGPGGLVEFIAKSTVVGLVASNRLQVMCVWLQSDHGVIHLA